MKLSENVGKPKDKIFPKDNEVVKYDLKSILEVFKTFFADMVKTLLEKLH